MTMPGSSHVRPVRGARLACAALLLAMALAACDQNDRGEAQPGSERSGSEQAGIEPTGIDWLDAPARPVQVLLDLDAANAQSRVITEKGGTLSVAGENGTFYTLEIPEGALVAPERITVTPVRRVDGLPLASGALAAVQLEPEGLVLQRPATLYIETREPVSPAERVAFAYARQGSDTHLYPATGDALEAQFKLLHFSGYGFGKAPPSDPGRIRLLYASTHASRLEARIAELLNREGAKQQAGGEAFSSETVDALATLYLEYFDAVIRPLMQVAETDDRMASCAMKYYLDWRRKLAVWGFEPENAGGFIGSTGADRKMLEADSIQGEMVRRMEEGSISALKIVRNVEKHLLERANEGCLRHDLTAYLRISGFYRQLALLGMDAQRGANPETLTLEAGEKCLRFELQFVSEIESTLPHFGQHFRVAAIAPYALDESVNSATLSYEEFTTSGRPMEDAFGTYTPQQDGTIEDAMRTTAELGLNYSLSPAGSRPGILTVVAVDWDVNPREVDGVGCNGRDEKQDDVVAENFRVTLRIDPPTEVVHYVPVHAGTLHPFNSDEHQWMRFFTLFRRRAGNDVAPPADAATLDQNTGEQAQLVTVELKKQENRPGIWRAELTTPDDGANPGTLSENGYLILRHTPANIAGAS